MTDRTAYINARVLDPATETDRVGSVLVSGNKIVEWGTGLFEDGIPETCALLTAVAIVSHRD